MIVDASSLNSDRLSAFDSAYRAGLRKAVQDHPAEYFYKPEEADKVVDKMMTSLKANFHGVNYDGHGFKNTCKALGIKHTQKAILAYLRGE